MTKEQMIEALAWLYEIKKEFRPNTNIERIIREYKERIKELEK